MTGSLGESLRDGIAKLLAPLAALETPQGISAMLASFGHGEDVAADASLRGALAQAATAAHALQQIEPATLDTWQGVSRVLQICGEAFAALRAVEQAAGDPAIAAQAANLGKQIADRLVALYLRAHHPRLHRAAAALTLLEPAELAVPSPLLLDGDRIVRMPSVEERLHFDRIGDLIADPWPVLRDFYIPNGLAQAADAHETGRRLFPVLASALESLGLRSFRDLKSLDPPPEPGPFDENEEFPDTEGGSLSDDPLTPSTLPPFDPTPYLLRHLPRLVALFPATDGSARLAVALLASSAEHEGGVAGIIGTVAGSLNWDEARGPWRLTAASDGEFPAFVFGPGGFTRAPAAVGGVTGNVRIAHEADTPAWLFGSAAGSRLELSKIRVGLDYVLTSERQEIALTLESDHAALVAAADDGDGLLAALLPSGGLSAVGKIGLSLSSDRGIQFGVGAPGASLSAEWVVGRSLGGLRLEAIIRSLDPIEDERGSGLSATIGIRLSTRLGPVEVSLDGIGVGADLLWGLKDPNRASNLGIVHLERIGFRPPQGIGLSIDASVITGGGFIRREPATGRYSGVLDLHAGNIGITAMALLDTRLPAGQGGYALLVALRATFPAIQVGLGFALTSVGGLLALNRRVDVDALRTQLAAGTAGRILAPEDPIRNAPALLADLGSVFPLAPGITVVGPTAQLVWAKLVRFDIGLFIELPGPSRIVLLGSVRAAIEGAGRTYLLIRVDLVGLVDLQQRKAAFDAVLIDSQLLEILDLTGGAAFRLCWGSQPYGVLTLGGFHPAYDPEPLVFPASLARIAMVYGTPEDRLYLRFEGYFAVTSNTLQLGASVQAAIKSGNFNIQGFLGFDALIHRDPFHFRIDIRASVAVRYRSRKLAGLTLTGSLEGPGPIVLRAKVCIELLFFDICFSDTFTLGSSTPPPATIVTNVLDLFRSELDNPAALHASGIDSFVALRPPPPGLPPIVSPVGQLVWVQRQAPLGLLLQRIGGTPLASPQSVEATSTGETAAELDWFAPGSFVDLTDDQALTRRAFERLDGGLRFGASGAIDGPAEQQTLTIRQIRLPAKARTMHVPTAFPLWMVADASRVEGSAPLAQPIAGAIEVASESWTLFDATGQIGSRLSSAQAHQLATLAGAETRRVAVPAGDRLSGLVF